MRWLPILVALATLLAPLPGRAHEVRPAYLDLREDRPGEYSVLWKTPMVGEMRLALQPDFSGPVEALTPVAARTTGDAAVQTWRLRRRACAGRPCASPAWRPPSRTHSSASPSWTAARGSSASHRGNSDPPFLLGRAPGA